MNCHAADLGPATVCTSPLIPGEHLLAVPARRGGIARRAPGDVRIQQIREVIRIGGAKRNSNLLRESFDGVAHRASLTRHQTKHVR